jgi:hypothetical protein
MREKETLRTKIDVQISFGHKEKQDGRVRDASPTVGRLGRQQWRGGRSFDQWQCVCKGEGAWELSCS